MPTYDRSIFSKLPKVETTIFSKMSAMANKFGALNLSQGFPDFEVDKKLLSLAEKSMNNGKNQYAPMPGLISLREKIAEKINGLYNVSYDPVSEITITSGATQAIFTAITAFVKRVARIRGATARAGRDSRALREALRPTTTHRVLRGHAGRVCVVAQALPARHAGPGVCA